MPNDLDTRFVNHAAIVGYALSMALFQMLDGGAMQGAAAQRALAFLPPRPPSDAPPADLQMWVDAEAALKGLANGA